MAHPKDTVWIVATGALTNVAVLIERFPEVVGHVRGLSVMGGGVGGGFIGGGKGGDGKGEGEREGTVQSEEEEEGDKRVGNWTWWAEFNIWSDPQAATQIFSHPILRKKTTLIPLDITHQVLATPEVLSRILHGSSSPSETKRHTEYTAGEGEQEDEKPRHATLRPLLHSILTFFAETYRSVFGFTRGPPVHDPVAVAVLLDSLVREDEDEDVEQGGRILPVSRERFGVTVVPHGDKGVEKTIEDERGMGSEGGGTGRREGQGGRTIVRLLPEGEEGVRVPRGVDAPAFWRVVEGCVERAEESLFIGEMEGKGRGR
ncbi:MAG: Uridine nucleosidase 1 [Caeruleum heppii]|nr:MAG: Uridine nucleosidase 1 [Caeruleum heppii]